MAHFSKRTDIIGVPCNFGQVRLHRFPRVLTAE